MVDLAAAEIFQGGTNVTIPRMAAPFDVHGNLLPPSFTTTQRDAIASPITGQLIYNSTTNLENFYNGTSWLALASSGQGSIDLSDLPLTSMATIVGNSSNFGSQTTILQIDPVHNSVGINHTPDATSVYDLYVNGVTGSGTLYSAGIVYGIGSVSTPLISGRTALGLLPSGDSTAGVVITKADGTTKVLTVDTTNQHVSIGPNVPDTKAVLDVQSTTAGMLPPRMTNTQRDAIMSPTEGLTIYSTSDHALEFYNGSAWKVVATV